MAKVLTVTNRKGGVGKSTVTITVAAGLAMMGMRVGVIDTDSQGHAAHLLNVLEANGLFDALINKRPLARCVVEVPPLHYAPDDDVGDGKIFLLPSSLMTYKIPHELSGENVFDFYELIQDFTDQFALDIIVIDTPPGMWVFDSSIYMVTDGFLYVSECERLSFDGIMKTRRQMAETSRKRKKWLGRGSEIAGILPNKMQPRTNLHRHNISALTEHFPDIIWSPVRLRIAWAESANLRESIFIYAPGGSEWHDAWDMTHRVYAWMTGRLLAEVRTEYAIKV